MGNDMRSSNTLIGFAVILADAANDDHVALAIFAYSDQAQKWADTNYSGRARVQKVRLADVEYVARELAPDWMVRNA